MKNYVQLGETIDHVVAGANIASGEARLVGVQVMVATKAAAIGETVAMQRAGVVSYAKQAALAIGQGVLVYHDSGADEVDTTGTNDFMGICAKAALAGDATVDVILLSPTA